LTGSDPRALNFEGERRQDLTIERAGFDIEIRRLDKRVK
jgi:hypothetical protein